MRTTITIDEDLYRRAKATAARHGRTVSELIEDAVRESLRPRRGLTSEVAPLPTFGGSGVLPGVDLADFRSLGDVMDADRRSMLCVDVNVLVYAHRPESPDHEGHRGGSKALGAPASRSVVADGGQRIRPGRDPPEGLP